MRPGLAAPLLMAASGFAGLGWQIVWTQQAGLWLGHEAAAVLAVVAAFFGGLALGALLLGPRVERSAHPARAYALCEAAVALWGLFLLAALAPAGAALLAAMGERPGAAWQWTVAFAGTAALLLPATLALGATLPAMARVAAAGSGPHGRVAALYAANTAGALAGVLASAFWLLPAYGLARTALVCAALNLGCAALAWRWPAAGLPTAAPRPVPRADLADRADLSAPGTLALLAATGLLGIAYEVLVVRVLGEVTEETVYTYALLLAVYLMGTALGAALLQRGVFGRHALAATLLPALAAACGLGMASLWGAETLREGTLEVVRALGGAGMAAALASEAALALAAFLLPTVLMGALFSRLAADAAGAGIGLGRALGLNTLGAALAPPLFGVVLLPALGAKGALLLVPAGYGALALRTRPRTATALGVVLLLAAALAPPLAFIDVPEGGRVLSYREGATASVSVVEDADGVARLRIDNRQQEGSSTSLLADARQALLPMLLHPAPRRALFLGLGTGVTATAAAQDPTLQVEVAELLPEVVEASAHFVGVFGDARVVRRPAIVVADARRQVRAGHERYDLVVSDNFHPARSGSAALYTVEHFAAVRARLAAGGLFCQWLPLHELDRQTLRSIVRAFLATYPEGLAMLATHSLETPVLGLIGRADGGRFDLAALQQRLAANALPQQLADYGLDDSLAVLGSFVAGPRALADLAGDAPLNTDDHPVVAYLAPRITYAPDSRPRDRLLALLGELRVDPEEIVDSGADRGYAPRLAAYGRARDRYFAAGRDVRPSADLQTMLAQVREPLLAVLRTSPDFRPARDPLQRMAAALAAEDPVAARGLMDELARIGGSP
jgi:spermidine synthase